MVDVSHVLAVCGAAVTGFLLILSGRKAPACPSIPPSGPLGVSDQSTSPLASPTGLTSRGAAELVGHEAIVLEAYKDSGGIWTWGIGVTDASGHKVERYIDHPQSVIFCLQIFIWLLQTKYIPDVLKAFEGYKLSENQFAAALSFHYNTGGILHASWVPLWKGGQEAAARASFMGWNHPLSITDRRKEECILFFDGIWSGDGKANLYPVLKPSYQPDFHHSTRVDVLTPLHQLLGI
jgi:lysozyme